MNNTEILSTGFSILLYAIVILFLSLVFIAYTIKFRVRSNLKQIIISVRRVSINLNTCSRELNTFAEQNREPYLSQANRELETLRLYESKLISLKSDYVELQKQFHRLDYKGIKALIIGPILVPSGLL
jgi:hypothetical protein